MSIILHALHCSDKHSVNWWVSTNKYTLTFMVFHHSKIWELNWARNLHSLILHPPLIPIPQFYLQLCSRPSASLSLYPLKWRIYLSKVEAALSTYHLPPSPNSFLSATNFLRHFLETHWPHLPRNLVGHIHPPICPPIPILSVAESMLIQKGGLANPNFPPSCGPS